MSAGTRGRQVYLPESVQKEEKANYRFGTVVALGDPALHPKTGRPIPWAVHVGTKVCFQFGADLTGERELQYTGGVAHAVCFAEDLIYAIEDDYEIQPTPVCPNSVGVALRRALMNDDWLTEEQVDTLSRRLACTIAGVVPA